MPLFARIAGAAARPLQHRVGGRYLRVQMLTGDVQPHLHHLRRYQDHAFRLPLLPLFAKLLAQALLLALAVLLGETAMQQHDFDICVCGALAEFLVKRLGSLHLVADGNSAGLVRSQDSLGGDGRIVDMVRALARLLASQTGDHGVFFRRHGHHFGVQALG